MGGVTHVRPETPPRITPDSSPSVGRNQETAGHDSFGNVFLCNRLVKASKSPRRRIGIRREERQVEPDARVCTGAERRSASGPPEPTFEVQPRPVTDGSIPAHGSPLTLRSGLRVTRPAWLPRSTPPRSLGTASL